MADGNFGNITATGNILAAGYISAAGNVTGANVRANTVSANLLSFGNASSTANLTVGNIAVYNNLNMVGNLSATGNVRGSYVLGNGSQLTGIAAASAPANALTGNTLTSTVTISSLTTVGALANLTVTGNTTANTITTNSFTFNSPTTANLSVGNLAVYNNLNMTGTISTSGNVAAARLVGNIVTANQPNITKVGTLSSLSVSGNIAGGNLNITGTITGNIDFENSLSVAGNITSNNTISANSIAFTNPTTANLIVGNIALYNNLNMTGNLSAAGNIIANNFNGPAFIATQTLYQGIPYSPTLPPGGILPVIYNNVTKNTGGGYNASTGIFTAPKSGYYQVSASIGVNPFANLSYYGGGAIVLCLNAPNAAAILANPLAYTVASGPFISLIVLNGNYITNQSSVSTLVYLNAGDFIQAVLAGLTNAPTGVWTTQTNAVPSSFQACWLRS